MSFVFDSTIAGQYAAAQGFPSTGNPNPTSASEYLGIYELRVNRVLYWHKTPVLDPSQSDCGSPGQVGLPGAAVGLKDAVQGVNIASSSIGIATALGATALTGISAVLGPVTAGLSLLIAPILAIFQHHQQAVAKEQGTICAVTAAYNAWAAGIENALTTGQATLQQAISATYDAEKQLTNALAPVSGIGNASNPCNAGCIWQKWIKVMMAYNREIRWPGMAPSGASGALDSLAQTTGFSTKQLEFGGAALVAGALFLKAGAL